MKKWIVFGAGAFGREVYYYYRKENIAYFVDNDLERVGDTFFGKEIISFKQYCRIYKQYDTVIAVRHYQSIERQILEKGITEYTIYLEQREARLLSDSTGCYEDHLYTPTFITKIGQHYFIVDCWHHRVIYSKELQRPISEWDVLDDALSGPHSIASDGEVYIVDDTDHGEVCIYKKHNECFIKTQTLYGLGFRPHKCIYDKCRKYFYILLSESCEIAVLKNYLGQVKVEAILKVEINTYYARSIQIIDDRLFIVCRTGEICGLSLDLSCVKIISRYRMPDRYAGLNDMMKVGDSYYFSIYTDLSGKYVPRIVRTGALDDFRNIEDMTERLGVKGVPYYFSWMDGRYYITEIDSCSGIASFLADGNDLTDRKELFFSQDIPNCSLKRKYGTEDAYALEVAGNVNIAVGMLKNISGRAGRLAANMLPQIADFYIGRERENLISWYPFRDGSDALEIVSECGSIADILCEKCRTVTSIAPDRRMKEMVRSLCSGYDNIEICIGQMPYGKKFHYIFAVNLDLAKLDKLLKCSLNCLEEDGRIIAVTDNRLSRKYWDDIEPCVFHRREEAAKREIESVCKKRGKHCSFYYPLPNWTKCEMICSNFSEKSLCPDTLERIYHSRPIYDDALLKIIENHAVGSLAASFLLEISDRENQRKKIAVNIPSTKRKKEYQINTRILEDGYVEKVSVYRAGTLHIENMKKNEMILEKRGIPILKGELKEKKYITKFLSHNTLDRHIYGLCKSGNRKEVLKLLEDLKGYICRSSDHIRYHGEDVLETGYPDMVCQNVFFDNGRFTFFDQEWTMEHIETGFIVYRAVKLLYLNNTELENIFPMAEMLEALHINESSGKYEKMDMMFRSMVHGMDIQDGRIV